MTGTLWALDIAIAGSLVGLAVLALASADLFRGVVLFMAFGLLMSMAWARLQAIDIALAEAAIGAGLTGALFLNAIAERRRRAPGARWRMVASGAGLAAPIAGAARHAGYDAPGRWFAGTFRWAEQGPRSPLLAVAAGAAVAGLAVAMGAALLGSALPVTGLQPHVEAALDRSGVSNPVTAVLLNFRAWDTLLEVAVLLLALIGVRTIGPMRRPVSAGPPGPVLLGLVYVLVPVAAVVGGYLLWTGTTAPGGAFQAAAVLAAAGVLLVVVRLVSPRRLEGDRVRLLATGGFLVFLGAGLAPMVAGGHLLEYPDAWAGTLIVAVEVALTVSIALVLVALFAGGAPRRTARRPPVWGVPVPEGDEA
jgi:multisubunit Na+/H+ antiporter MnhB subunit